MANFAPLRSSVTGTADLLDQKIPVDTNNNNPDGASPIADGQFLVDTIRGRLNVDMGTVRYPIAQDVIVGKVSQLTAARALNHRLAIATDGTSTVANDGIVRSVNGSTPNSSGAVTITYTQVGAAPTSHTHTMSQITDLRTELNKIDSVFNFTVGPQNSWTVISGTDENGNDNSVITCTINTGLAKSGTETILLDLNTDDISPLDPSNFQSYIQEFQKIYAAENLSGTNIKLYANRELEKSISLRGVVLYLGKNN